MSLLQKASIITTPTAYAEDYLYSIKPAIPFGDELVTNGNFYSNSDWNLDSGWSISGGKLIATNTALEATQTNVFTTNKTYKITFTIDSISSGSVKIKAGTTSGTIRTTAGTYTQVLTVSSGTSLVFDMHSSGSCVIDNVSAKEATDADFDFDRNSTGTRVNEDYLIETVAANIPRIDYTNGEPSILLEPSRTNNVTKSNSDFTVNNTTITYNNINSPEGIQNAFKVECTSSGTAVFARTGSIAFTDPVTFSVFVKYGNVQYLQLLTSKSNTHFLNFDVENGIIGTKGSNTEGEFVQYPNGWYRVSATFSGFSSSNNFRLYISNSNSASYAGGTATVGDFYYAYGWQVENGSYPTSLIHTSGSAVTRSADSVRNAGNSDLISNSEGVLYAELARTSDNAFYELIAISSGNANYQNIVALGFDANNNEIWYRAKLGNTDLIIVSAGAEVRPQNEFFKIAIKYKSGDSKVYLNGRMIDSSTTTGSTSVAFTTLDLAFFNIYNFNGKLKNVTVFKEALTDLELEKLTGYNNHELYMNYYNRLSYLGLVEEYNVESDINNYIL